jgi:flagellar hook-length control protein FliK
MEKATVNAVDEMDKPFIPDMDGGNTLPKTDTLKLYPLNNTESLRVFNESFDDNIQQLELYSSNSHEINIKELPETYKQLAQNISPENKKGMPIPAINNSSNAKEQLTENGLSKINGTASSKQDISSIVQTNEDWNSFDSHTQKQNTSDTVSSDAHTPKLNNGTPFSLDSQTTLSNAQSNVTDFQQNTKAPLPTGASLSSPIEDAKTVNHTFHSNDVSNVGHTHENIMEQIFQKIRITTHGDRSEIKLSLNPPDLGNVKIHFTEKSDEIEAKIFVENAEVKAAVESNVHRLKESVAANGIEIHKLEVYVQNNDANKQESIENFNTNNPHHQNHTFSQNGFHEGHAGNEENMNDRQIEIRRNTSNLTVDYII